MLTCFLFETLIKASVFACVFQCVYVHVLMGARNDGRTAVGSQEPSVTCVRPGG